MNLDGLRKIMDSKDLSEGEKKYLLDWQCKMGGSFSIALFHAIGLADQQNLAKLEASFPEEVQGFKAWAYGDLYERASKIAGGDVGIMTEETDGTSNLD